MSKVDRRGAMQRFHLGQHRFELSVDKNGKPWSFEFGRPLPRWGDDNRAHLMKVPETLSFTHLGNKPRIMWHGVRCDRCMNWEACKKEIPGNAAANYCERTARGFRSLP